MNTNPTAEDVQEALQALAMPEKATFYPRFFKAGPGDYAEGDQFIGVTVPDQRKIVREFWYSLTLTEVSKLLSSEIHEHRHTALLILVRKFEKTTTSAEQRILLDFYLDHKPFINNWDLVDNSCYKILGRYCFENDDDSLLRSLAKEDSLWSRRMAIVSTIWHVKKGHSFDTVKELFLLNLHHPHDLMHKANGWLLREMGEKDQDQLTDFLKKHYKTMPRTTLRYAIEKFEPALRQAFLKGTV